MRSLLPERRCANGHILLEGAIVETHQALLAHIGQEIDRRLRPATNHMLGRASYTCRGHAPYIVEQTCACPPMWPRAESALQPQRQPAAAVVDALGHRVPALAALRV